MRLCLQVDFAISHPAKSASLLSASKFTHQLLVSFEGRLCGGSVCAQNAATASSRRDGLARPSAGCL